MLLTVVFRRRPIDPPGGSPSQWERTDGRLVALEAFHAVGGGLVIGCPESRLSLFQNII